MEANGSIGDGGLLLIIPDLRRARMHIRAEVPQSHQRFAAGVLDLHAAGRRFRRDGMLRTGVSTRRRNLRASPVSR